MLRTVSLLLLSASLLTSSLAPAGEPREMPSEFERDKSGWKDLLEGDKELKKWKRVPIGGKLREKSPWSVSDDGKSIKCDGVGVHEMLLYDKELTDGIFHVEWRFEPTDKKGYNSGVYIRNSGDGKVWHQAQVGLSVGQIFGSTLAGDKAKSINVKHKGVANRGKTAGEWNTFELTAKGKVVTLWVNGQETARIDDMEVLAGYIGLEAEGYVIEFKNLLWKE